MSGKRPLFRPDISITHQDVENAYWYVRYCERCMRVQKDRIYLKGPDAKLLQESLLVLRLAKIKASKEEKGL